jgi:hypothetical protein
VYVAITANTQIIVCSFAGEICNCFRCCILKHWIVCLFFKVHVKSGMSDKALTHAVAQSIRQVEQKHNNNNNNNNNNNATTNTNQDDGNNNTHNNDAINNSVNAHNATLAAFVDMLLNLLIFLNRVSVQTPPAGASLALLGKMFGKTIRCFKVS